MNQPWGNPSLTAARIRAWLLPAGPTDKPQLPLWLIYLGFLFIPASGGWNARWLLPTLASLPVFFVLFFRNYRHAEGSRRAETLGLVLLGCALVPFNPFANTYLLYACGFAAYLRPGLWVPLAFTGGVLLVYAIEILLLGQSIYLVAMTTLISIPICIGNAYHLEQQRGLSALRRSHEEIRRLAATAERERIGRDLHDLLGHTLSLIAVKLDLADRLADRDAASSRRELRDAREIAREALAQVRSAVTGIRNGGLAAELASSRVLLESSRIEFRCEYAELELSPELEAATAMILREAVTNIQRHARAQKAVVRIRRDDDKLCLEMDDDGQGGLRTEGNGLTGMRERVAALGGTLSIDSPRGGGTHLKIRLPLRPCLAAELRGAA